MNRTKHLDSQFILGHSKGRFLIQLDELGHLPDGILETGVEDVQRVFSNPTLVHLPGEYAPIFVSILLHGNEDAGWLALQEFVRRRGRQALRRGLVLFVGNVESCAPARRFLTHQVDFNRAWPGSDLPRSPVHDLLETVTDKVLRSGIVASIDVHNNTGRNPHYGCICSEEASHIRLASMFSRRVVYFTKPHGVQTQAFMHHCPSVTCECGKIGDHAGAVRAADLIDACVADDFKEEALVRDVEVYSMIARIKVREHCTVGFDTGADIVLRKDLDLLNFQNLDAGEEIGTLSSRIDDCFVVNDTAGHDVTSDYLTLSNQHIRFGKSVMPSMLTQDLDVIKKDCLGYIMERKNLDS